MFRRHPTHLLLALVLAASPAFSQDASCSGDQRLPHPVMHFSRIWFRQHLARRARMKVHRPKRREEIVVPAIRTATGVNLLPNLLFASAGGASGWNQGQCGNCWVWGSTAACSQQAAVALGSSQLFSTQWFDSDYYETQGGSVCGGGDTTTFASWYNSHPKFIPWTNANADYADGAGPSSPATPASSIGQTPSVSFTSIQATKIPTDTVSQAEAIANIKAVLDANQAVTLAFFLPSDGWTDFQSSWSSDSESTPWAGVDKYSGSTESGGHLVCVVGYDDANGTWIVLNSWGTTSGRPDGYFSLSQTMNYSDTISYGSGSMPQYEFDTYDIAGWPGGGATAPAITTQPQGQTVALGQSAQFSVVASGSTPLSYQWFRDSVEIPGATGSRYATPAATAADNGAIFHVTVTNSAGSVTSNDALLAVTSSAPEITTQPASQTVAVGSIAHFSVVAMGTQPLSYQWFRGGSAISGATGTSYSTPPVTSADNGATFHVIVTDSAGSVTSSSATLMVTSVPGSNLIVNGGFENGGTGWTATSGVIVQGGSSEPPHGGAWAAWFRFSVPRSRGQVHVFQTVQLPSLLVSATLAFYLHIDSWAQGKRPAEFFEAQICDSRGNLLKSLGKYSNADAGAGFRPYAFDVSAFKGERVRVQFVSYGAAGHARTSFVLDDVSLAVQ